MGEERGVVYVGEAVDGDDIFLMTGLFQAHWESSGGDDHRDGPQRLSVDEAIAWGRTQADVVLVRLADSDVHYSAGVRQPVSTEDDTKDLPIWPEGRTVKRRREKGMEHLDLVADRPFPWRVRFPRRVSRRHAKRDSRRLVAALVNDPDVSDVRTDLQRDGRHVNAVLRYSIEARTHEEAVRLVFEIEQRSMDDVPYPVPFRGLRHMAFFVSTGFNPMNDIRPAE